MMSKPPNKSAVVNRVRTWRGLPEFCTAAQLARAIRCSPGSIVAAIRRDELCAEKRDGAWRIHHLDAADWFLAPYAAFIDFVTSDEPVTVKI
jgi:hypothetical protein